MLPVPAAVLWAGLTYQAARGPYWLGTNYDPAYAYLLNSLRLAQLQSPQHVDHPGTTVHWSGALTLRLVNRLLGAAQGLEDDVLVHPEFYLRILTGSFLCLYVVLLYLCGSLALDVTGSVPLAWLVQATPFFSFNGFLELADVKPEPLLFSVAAAMMAAILWTLKAKPPSEDRLAAALGAITGFAIATKVTALSLCAVPLVLLRRGRTRGAWALWSVAGFLLCTTPIFIELVRLFRFLLQIVRGSGLYGKNLFADKVDYWSRLERVIREEILFVSIALAGAFVYAVLVWVARRRDATEVRGAVLKALLALLAVDALQIMLVLKQPYQPRYLLPAMGLVGLNLALMLKLLCWDESGRARPFVCLLVLAGLAVAGHYQGRRLRQQVSGLRAMASGQKQARRTAESFTDCPVVNYYRSSSLPEALRQGNLQSGLGLGEKLEALYPGAVFLDGSARQFQSYRGTLGADEWAQRWSCLVLQGSPGGPSRPFSGLSELERETIPVTGPLEVAFEAQWEAVWVSGKSRTPLPARAFSGWTHATGLGDAEGPYPEWGLPMVRWGLGQQTRLSFQGTGQRMGMLAEGRAGVPDQVLVVLINGREAARHVYSKESGFETLALTFDTEPGSNQVVFQYRAAKVVGARALAVLFRRLQISPASVDAR